MPPRALSRLDFLEEDGRPPGTEVDGSRRAAWWPQWGRRMRRAGGVYRLGLRKGLWPELGVLEEDGRRRSRIACSSRCVY